MSLGKRCPKGIPLIKCQKKPNQVTVKECAGIDICFVEKENSLETLSISRSTTTSTRTDQYTELINISFSNLRRECRGLERFDKGVSQDIQQD